MQRDLDVSEITVAVRDLSIEANLVANCDLREAFISSLDKEVSPVGKAVLAQLIENQDIAKTEKIPICQDTGFTVVYLELGMDVKLTGATGGAAALLSRSIIDVEVIGFDDLGTEAIRKLLVKDMPVIVINDSFGGDLYEEGIAKYKT